MKYIIEDNKLGFPLTSEKLIEIYNKFRAIDLNERDIWNDAIADDIRLYNCYKSFTSLNLILASSQIVVALDNANDEFYIEDQHGNLITHIEVVTKDVARSNEQSMYELSDDEDLLTYKQMGSSDYYYRFM